MAIDFNNKTPSFEQRMYQESTPWFVGSISTPVYTNQTLVQGSQLLQMYTFAGEAAFLRKFRFFSTIETEMELQLRNVENGLTASGWVGVDTGSSYSIDERFMLTNNSPVEIDFGGLWIRENTQMKLTVSISGGYTGINGKIICSCNTPRFTNDLNWAADRTVLVIGDSIVKGSLGTINTFTGSDIYPWKVRDYFISKGQDTRLVNKGAGGRTSRDGRDWMIKQRFYDIYEAHLIIWSFGMNNVLGGFNESKQAAYLLDIQDAIAWKQGKYPRAIMMMCGPSPAQEPTREANLVIARGIVQQAVIDANDSRVLYLNLGSAFDPTDTAYYSTTDGSGDRLHPNILGHQAIYDNCFVPFLDESVPRI